MKNYKQFYTSFGVRSTGQLVNPPLPQIDRLELPRQSIVHYFTDSLTEDGPRVDYPLLSKNKRPIRIKHIFELAEKTGNPRRKTIQVTELARNFRTANPKFRNFVDTTTMLREPDNLTVVNYCFLPRLYKYQRTRLTPWNKLMDRTATLLHEIKAFDGQGFNQFLEIQIPEKLPKVSLLYTAEQMTNPLIYHTFANQSLFILLQIWSWLGPNRNESLIHRIFPNGFTDLNLIIRESNRFCVISMAKLQQWRKGTSEELKLNKLENRKGTDPQATQRRFLRLLMSVAELRVNDLPENLGDEIVEEADNSPKLKDGIVIDGSLDTAPGTEEDDAFQEAITSDLDILEEFGGEITDLDPVDDPDGIIDEEVDLTLDQDKLDEELEKFPDDPKEAFLRKAAELADRGDISAGDYRRAVDAVNSGKLATVKGEPIDEFIKITKEDLAIEQEPIAPDLDVIVDKSMLKSSLNQFDKKYVNNVMQKDIASMVHNLMGAGVQVLNYDVTEVNTAGGQWFEYVVQIKPLDGRPSTIRFKMPKINDEGTYMVNGVKYYVRKQKGDLPIRLIRPSRVALTSYYGRLFVDRSEKRVNDYGRWITSKVYLMGIDNNNNTIVNLESGNTFNHEAKVPRLYSALSMSFRSFGINIDNWGLFSCHFFPKKAEEVFGIKLTENCMFKNYYIMGKNKAGQFLAMDKDGLLCVIDGEMENAIGSFENAIGLEAQRAPVEFATCGILGEDISVGVVLGYLMGFSKLCKTLGVEPRTVPAGKRLNLTEDEWAMAFEDQTLIFKRSDRKATMVLAGMREYHKTLVTFPLSEFNHQDVYLNLLEEKKIGARYIRELGHLQDLFIDPITRELLKDMNEPTVFRDLLIRSCELLLIDYHPHEQDAAYMRIKGYERMSGILYASLVRAVRKHAGIPGKSRYGIELNPHEVWMEIQDDTAKDQVNDSNPIQNLKQTEALTYSGDGGRKSRTIVARNRIYHKNDMGVTSESTVDSSDVAVNMYMSANPKLNSLRGTADRWSLDEDGLTSLLSTSAMTSIGTLRDDQFKRSTVVGILQCVISN